VRAVGIRPAVPGDRACVAALLRGLSPDAAYRRFQTALGPDPTSAMLDALLPAGPNGGALLAHAGPWVIGHGVWQRSGATSVAEIGVVVADSQQRRGIGSALAGALLDDLARRGMTEVEVFASATNEAVSRMVAASAPAALLERDGGTVTYRFDVMPGVAARTVA
jgi:GNAT superfamily N-acetyltransferase